MSLPELSRRAFLFLTGGAGIGSIVDPGRKAVNKLIPWVVPPEHIRPGEWTIFASTCRECPAGCGMHVRHRDGRPTKAEGNPRHPINRGGLCARGQSALQGIYDPDRVKYVYYRESRESPLLPSDWQTTLQALGDRLRNTRGKVAILSDLQTGTLAEIMKAFVHEFDSERLLFYEVFNYEPLRHAHREIFGEPVIPQYRLENSDFILCFGGAEFLETWVSPVGMAYDFSEFHSLKDGKIGRMAYIGPRLSMTATNADIFHHMRPGEEQWAGLAILEEMAKENGIRKNREEILAAARRMGSEKAHEHISLPREEIRKLARLLGRAKNPVVLAGNALAGNEPAREVAVAGALLNAAVGAPGRTMHFSRRHALGKTATDEELIRFLEELDGEDTLIINHSNPVYTRPHLIEKLRRAGTIVYMSSLPDETAALADWVLPVDTPLEKWGDYEPYTGIHGIIQPTMGRMYDARSEGDILIALADAAGKPLSREGEPEESPDSMLEWLRRRWSSLVGKDDFGPGKEAWKTVLQRGGIWKDISGEEISFRKGSGKTFSPPQPPAEINRADLWVWPSIFFFDGRLSNRAWLQESPHPVGYASWSSWLDINLEKARELGIGEDELVEIATASGSMTLPARLTLDVPREVVGLTTGQGHIATDLSVAHGVGVNAFTLLGNEGEGVFGQVVIRPTGRRGRRTVTTETQDQFHREVIQWVKLSEVGKPPKKGKEIIMPTPAGYHESRDLYPSHEHKDHRWAMAVDLQRCIGCGACGVACYAENNIPIMGQRIVEDGLEMAWLKIPPYRHPEDPLRVGWLPLPCQHCDAAPCEPVCPVFAAVHNEEGLNAQVYNRCIGTRYCSNNCPYKVRRFNWYDIRWEKPLDMQLNPEVTVRSRGVMEKCTFCVQRIRQAEYQARREGRKVRDGEVTPACVQTCPTNAFAFGDLMDPEAKIHHYFHEEPRRYQVLRELNTKPAVVYLRRIHIDT